uniref:MFS transporter n=1 Tax=Paenibacillus sp. FSL R10-2782 TaxID=2954661 RepID=UPI00406C4084
MPWINKMLDEPRKWPRNIRLFFIANLLYQMGTGMFSVLYNLYIQGLGFGDDMNGRVVSMQALATALLFIPVGFLGDRRSRKHMLVIGALFSGVAFLIRTFTDTSSSMLVFAVVSGVFAAFIQVLAVPFLAESISKAQRLKIFSYYSALVLAAQVMGSFGGGVLADGLQTWGITQLSSLRVALFLGGTATLTAFIPLLFMTKATHVEEEAAVAKSTPEPVSANTAESTSALPVSPAPAASSDTRVIGQFVLAQFFLGLGSGLVIPYLNLYFTNRFSVSLSAMSLLIALGQLMTILSMLIGPTLSSRIGLVKAVVGFQLLSLPFLLITGFTNVLWIASISFLFRQALMNAANPLQTAILVERVSDKNRGIANSVLQTTWMLGTAGMGPVQAYLITTYGNYWGYAITFSMTGVLYILSSLVYYWMFRENRPSAGQLLQNPASP